MASRSTTLVVGAERPGDLVAAALVALERREAGRAVTLGTLGAEAMATTIGQWWAEEPEAPPLLSGESLHDLVQASSPAEVCLAFGGGGALLSPGEGERARLEQAAALDGQILLVGLGAEAAEGVDPEEAHRALLRIASMGGLVDVRPILRFGAVGRLFIELVEHLHHESGPEAQNILADTIRAALFGHTGRRPVSLPTRERPPRVDASTALIFTLSAREVWAYLDASPPKPQRTRRP